MAATLADTKTGRAIRMTPTPSAGDRASMYVPDIPIRWRAQLTGYQVMPVTELPQARPVSLTVSLTELLGRPGVRINCASCGEEILHSRKILLAGRVLCRGCAGERYYDPPATTPAALGGDLARTAW